MKPPLVARLRSLSAVAATLARRTGRRALDLLYPGFCRECERPVEGPNPFCPRCTAEIRWIGSACPRCGQPAINPGPDSCGSCVDRPLFFDRAAFPCEYTGPWRRAVLRFKYLGDQGLRAHLGQALSRLYAARFAVDPPQALVPVPGHPWRKLTRGRDPVEELALDLANRTGLPLRRLLKRTRWTVSQTSLLRSERLRNPRGAYALLPKHRSCPGRRPLELPRSVLLLDDVFTTGATASECARALKEGGVRTVLVTAAARSSD